MHLNPGDTVIDVGANVGHFSILVADIVGPANLVCFEPTPIAWRRLCENFQLNGWSLTNLYPYAVGAERGTVAYSDSETPATTNSIRNDARSGKTFQAKVVALDDRLDAWKGKPIGLLKIDVEGYEPEVFRGAVRLIQDVRPRLIMFESLDRSADSDIRALLDKSGYILFQLNDRGSPVRKPLDAQNLFAVPRELADEYRVVTGS
jgi:FkbM family methyltransferase